LIIGGVILGILLLICGGVGVWFAVRNSQKAAFKPALATYLALPATAPPAGSQPKPVGKMVVVDRTAKEVSDLTFDLPADLRASKPEDVTTVVLLETTKKKVTTYDDGSTGSQVSITVTVVDLATQTVTAQKTFEGAPPDEDAEDEVGDAPSNDTLRDYLKSLPRN
jgi:hypothetical protein